MKDKESYKVKVLSEEHYAELKWAIIKTKFVSENCTQA
jgi:hypothetical protein